MACEDQINTEDLINAKTDAVTLGEVATSRTGAESGGAPITTSTNRFGEVTDTIQGRLNKFGVLFDDPIRDWSASLLVSDLRAHRYPATTGDIYIPTKPLPFTTGATFNTNDWVVLQGITTIELINDLSKTYEFSTVAEYESFTSSFPIGKRIYLADRDAHFDVITGTGTGNDKNIIASDQVSQSLNLPIDSSVNLQHIGAPTGKSNDATSHVQHAINLINSFLWKGTVPATGQDIDNNQSGEVVVPPETYRLTSQILCNPYVAIVGIERGIEFRQDFNEHSGDSFFFCDFADKSQYVFDTAPFDVAGVRQSSLDRVVGTGIGSTSTKMGGVKFKNLTIVSNHDDASIYGGIRFAAAPGFEFDHCIIEGFITAVMVTGCWAAKNTNNLILSKGVGVAYAGVVNGILSYGNYINLWRDDESLTDINAPYIDAEDSTTNPASTRFLNTGIYLTGVAIVSSKMDVMEHWDRLVRSSDFSQVVFDELWVENIQEMCFEGILSKIVVNNAHFFSPSVVLFVMRGDGEYVLDKPDGNYGELYLDSGTPTDSQLELYGVYPKDGDNYERKSTKVGRKGQRQIWVDTYERQPVKTLFLDDVLGSDANSGMLLLTNSPTAVAPIKTLEEALNRIDESGSYEIKLKKGGTFTMGAFAVLPASVDVKFSAWGDDTPKPIIDWTAFGDRVANISFGSTGSLAMIGVEVQIPNASAFQSDSRTMIDTNGVLDVIIDFSDIKIGGGAGVFGNKPLARGTITINLKGAATIDGSSGSYGALSRSAGTNSAYVQVIAFKESGTVNASIGTWGSTTSVLYSDF